MPAKWLRKKGQWYLNAPGKPRPKGGGEVEGDLVIVENEPGSECSTTELQWFRDGEWIWLMETESPPEDVKQEVFTSESEVGDSPCGYLWCLGEWVGFMPDDKGRPSIIRYYNQE